MKRPLGIVALLLCSVLSALAATTTVTATGSCPADPDAIQAAVNAAAPGDVIELSPGNPATEFDFTCHGVTVTTIGVTLAGVPSATVVRGPGFSGQGVVVQAAGVTIKDITFKNFLRAVRIIAGSAGPPSNVTISHSRFEDNLRAVVVAQDIDHVSLIGNTVVIPTPPNSDIFALDGESWGFIIFGQCDDLLVAENTFVGPGRVVNVQTIDQLLASSTFAGLNLRTIGVAQVDTFAPVSRLGRFSGNTFTGLDFAFQSSSDAGVVARNIVTNNGIGIAISQDSADSSLAVSDNIVALNTATGNQVGMVLHAASGNVVTLNNLSGNSLVGLIFFDSGEGGAASESNVFLRNQGSVRNVAGNQGLAIHVVLP